MTSPLEAPERLAAAAARGLTRRRMLRNAGGVAFGAAVTTAYLGRGADEVKAVCSYHNICGPAPACGGWRCSGYNCIVTSRTKWAHWEPGAAPCSGNSGVDNCWVACSGGTRYFCCDCCARDASCTSGSGCFSCPPGTWHKCICKGASGSC